MTKHDSEMVCAGCNTEREISREAVFEMAHRCAISGGTAIEIRPAQTAGRSPGNPEQILERAETAYTAQDIDRIMELFDPEIAFYWNGRKLAEGVAEMRAVHEERFSADDGYEQFQGDKTLRAASGDTIAVEFETTWIYPDGSRHDGHGSEFWMLRDDRLRDWHAYYVEYVQDGDNEYLSPEHLPFTR